MTRIISIIIFLTLMGGCNSSTQYDLSLLHSYTFKLDETFHEKEKLDPPYTALFKTQNHELLFFASRHAADIHSSTFQGIKKNIQDFLPDLVIIEGFQTEEGINPHSQINHVKQVCLPDWKCSENYYGIYLASLADIPFLGAEPAELTIRNVLLSQNYTLKDILFFYFTRQIPQYYREKQIRFYKDLGKIFPEFLSRFNNDPGYTFYDYTNWLKEKMNQEISWESLIDLNFTAPLEEGHYIQNLSGRIGLIRDQHILTTVLENLTRYRKILLIIGASHYPLQKDVLIKYLGKPVYFQH